MASDDGEIPGVAADAERSRRHYLHRPCRHGPVYSAFSSFPTGPAHGEFHRARACRPVVARVHPKNIAGPIMACLSSPGSISTGADTQGRCRHLLRGDGSSCCTPVPRRPGLVPFRFLIVVLPSLIGMRLGTPILFALAMIATAVGTLGIVFLPPVKHLAAIYFPDLTYTGARRCGSSRAACWRSGHDGYAMKASGDAAAAQPGPAFPTGLGHPDHRACHDGYLDIAVLMGIPALCVRSTPSSSRRCATTCASRCARRTSISAILHDGGAVHGAERLPRKLFFHRGDPVWLFFVLGVLGLRHVSLRPIAVRSPS